MHFSRKGSALDFHEILGSPEVKGQGADWGFWPFCVPGWGECPRANERPEVSTSLQSHQAERAD